MRIMEWFQAHGESATALAIVIKIHTLNKNSYFQKQWFLSCRNHGNSPQLPQVNLWKSQIAESFSHWKTENTFYGLSSSPSPTSVMRHYDMKKWVFLETQFTSFFSGLTSCPDICLMPYFVLFWPCLQLPFNGHIGALESFSLNTVYHFLYFCGLMSLPLAERWQWWNIQDLHVLWFWWIDLFWTDFKISARSRHCA